MRIVQELEEIIADQAVLITLYLRPVGHAVRTDLVGNVGYQISFSNEPRFWNLEEWYVIEPQPGTLG